MSAEQGAARPFSAAPSAPLGSREDVLSTLGRTLGAGIVRVMSRDPREAALAAYIPHVTPSVEALEARIRARHLEAERRHKLSA